MTEKYLNIELKDGGAVKIELLPEVAPKHVTQITALARNGAYDGVAFHRVIDGFMAQTGDVEHGVVGADGTWRNEEARWLEAEPELATIYAILALQETLKPRD